MGSSEQATARDAEVISLFPRERHEARLGSPLTPVDGLESIDDRELELLVASGLAMRDVAWRLGTSLERIYQRLVGLRVALDERAEND